LAIIATAGTISFLAKVHGFGFRISDPRIGAFYSAFTREKLSAIDQRISEGETQPYSLIRLYEDEGCRHLFQRDFYDTNNFLISGTRGTKKRYYKDRRKSRNENRIMETYYSAFLNKSGRIWDAGKPRGNSAKDAPGWESRVKSTIITEISFQQALAKAAVCITFLSLALLLIKRAKKV
jgi:hypothetical protein